MTFNSPENACKGYLFQTGTFDREPAGGVSLRAYEFSLTELAFMPQHKSAAKRVRQNETRRIRNRYHRSRMRTMIKGLKETTDADQAALQLKDVKSYLDRLATKGILHNNTAANYKSQLEKHVNQLA